MADFADVDGSLDGRARKNEALQMRYISVTLRAFGGHYMPMNVTSEATSAYIAP